jgi:ABC-type Fe3+ transport system permease subunit
MSGAAVPKPPRTLGPHRPHHRGRALAPVAGAAAADRGLRRGAAQGDGEAFGAFQDPDGWAAVRLTLLVAAICVPLNAVFGLAAAWAIAKFEFRGKSLLLTLIDLPFSVSPVISGLVWVLLFGARLVAASCCWTPTSRSSSPCRASCWPPSSSPSPSWRAS